MVKLMLGKKIISIFFITLSILIMNDCSVNNNTGLIVIYNLTDKTVNNIKIDETILSLSIIPGAKIDYWIFSPIEGKIISNEINEVLGKFLVTDSESEVSYTIYKDNPVCLFKTNYEYHLDIINVDNKIRLYINPGFKASENTEYDYPAL